jgi:glycosyltransferase involved in cell wall biosynthesis
MRIGIMLRAYEEKGGVGVYTRNITRHLLEHGPQHEFFLYFSNRDSLEAYADCANAHARFVPPRGKFLWDQVLIPRQFRRDRLDVLFHPKFTVPLLCASKSVMMLHGAGWFIPEVQHFWSRTTRLYTRMMMPIYCRLAGAVLAVSEITREVFIERLGVAPDKITTLYFAPGKQFNVPPDEATTEAVKARYALPERFILTLSGGDRAERKNFGAILEAIKRVHARQPCALVVAGRGCEEFRTRYNIPDEGWGRDVHFPGWVDQADLPVLFREAELFLYPSNMEAHPIPVTEALATGTPIVTSNAYGLKELAGDAALLVDPSDPDAIADAVLKLVSDPGLREELKRRAAVRSKLFDWDRCTHRTLGILERVGSGRRAANAS